MSFRLPSAVGENVSIYGRNGTGKTQAGAWLLSTRPLHAMPWVIVDYKRDELLNSIEKTRIISTRETPDEPGLYILHANPNDDDVEKWMMKIWEKGNTGIMFDEGYMVPNEDALTYLSTQGRSLHIPMIMLSQRPSYINRFTISEAAHYMVFHLNDTRDEKIVQEYTPRGFFDLNIGEGGETENKPNGRLPDYHSRWYNVKSDKAFVMRPVPDAEIIKANIERQLVTKKRWL